MSEYYPQKNACFIHIPKCGGTWIENVLHQKTKYRTVNRRQSCGRHAGYGNIRENTRKWFSTVREPVSWFESYWRFCHGSNKWTWEPKVWHPTDCLSTTNKSETFDVWIESVYEQYPAFLTRMYEAFVGQNGQFPWIKTFRLEDLSKDIEPLFKFLELDSTAPRLKSSAYNRSNFTKPEVSEATRKLITTQERNLYTRFNYDI